VIEWQDYTRNVNGPEDYAANRRPRRCVRAKGLSLERAKFSPFRLEVP
jgi:hypothetical protein